MSGNVVYPDHLLLGLESDRPEMLCYGLKAVSPRFASMARQHFEYRNRKEIKNNVIAAKEAAICPTAHDSLVVPFEVRVSLLGKCKPMFWVNDLNT